MKIYEFWFIFHCSQGSNWQYSITGSDNGFSTPTKWQAIIGINDGKFTNAYMCHSASMILKKNFSICVLLCVCWSIIYRFFCKSVSNPYIGPGNGLLPGGTKSAPEPMLTYH